jgi:Ser/Thr protein kinase RdoA (MazF antagonist)
VRVARRHGLAAAEPRVVRDLSNVLVALAPDPVVARIATSTAAARPDGARDWLAREVAVAGFLAGRGAAVVAPASELPPGPHTDDGFAITFWRLVEPDPERPASQAETAASLERLHAELEGFDGELPPLASVLDEAAGLIERLGLGARVRDALVRARSQIEALGLPARPLHGDAHRGNLLRTPGGLLWTDFEDTCRGPAEWDLACMVADREGQAEPRLEPFVEARLLQVAAWTALTAEHNPQLRTRARERLSRWG